MSALKLEPQEENAPKYLRKYYHGYTPELYKEIVDLWRSCKSIDVKRKTALDYAKRAQEKDLENKRAKECDKYRDYTFITFNDKSQKFLKDEDVFIQEFRRHIKALLLHLENNFIYTNDIKIYVNGYAPYRNAPGRDLLSWDFFSLQSEIQRGTIMTYSSVARDTWKRLMDEDHHNIQKRTIEGWKIYGDNSGKRFYIEFLYDPRLFDLIKEEKERRIEEYRNNHPTPDSRGYGGGPGHYTGD